MIYGVGVDIVEIVRIEKAVARWGERFLKRIFTDAEIVHCRKRASAVSCFALRFAAKEAFSKAIGFGFSRGLKFKHIEVVRPPNERPVFSLHGRAGELWNTCGLKHGFLSLSDDGAYAVAMVVLEV